MSNQITISQYLKDCGSECVPVDSSDPDETKAATILLPGWEVLSADIFPSAYQVLVNPANIVDGWAPNAVLLHGRMSKRVDGKKLLGCAFVDSRRLPSWQDNQESRLDFLSHPSAFISGSYEMGTAILMATTRYVVTETAVGQYLTQLTVTISADQRDALEIDMTVMNLAFTVDA